jgi:hypothetical protein
VKRTGHIFLHKSAFSKVPIILFACLLLASKLASSFLHNHQTNSNPEHQVVAIHCDACEYEATQAIEPGAAIVLPVIYSRPNELICEIASSFYSVSHSSSESRGPPQAS